MLKTFESIGLFLDMWGWLVPPTCIKRARVPSQRFELTKQIVGVLLEGFVLNFIENK